MRFKKAVLSPKWRIVAQKGTHTLFFHVLESGTRTQLLNNVTKLKSMYEIVMLEVT